MKNKALLFLSGCIALLLVSCMNNDDVEYTEYKDCRITTFSLSHDSIPALSSVRFTIDQLTGKIFNIDSMPFGTVLKEKVICTLNYGSGTQGMKVITDSAKDTLWWSGNDSIDFRKPVHFTTFSFDNVTKLSYVATLNIHQVNPDTMVWNKKAVEELGFPIQEETVLAYTNAKESNQYLRYEKGTEGAYRLFVSPMGSDFAWTEMSLSGLPSQGLFLKQLTRVGKSIYVWGEDGLLYKSEDAQHFESLPMVDKLHALLGGIEKTTRQEECLVALLEKDKVLRHAVLDKDGIWHLGKAVSEDFPIKRAASTSFKSMGYNRLFLAGGYNQSNKILNNAWVTLDGFTWAMTTKKDSIPFGSRANAAVVQYDDKLFLVGGFDVEENPIGNIYVSPDEGITWIADTMVKLPATFQNRGGSSLVVDSENFMHIFGGSTKPENEKVLDEIWTGRINRLGFINQ